MKVEILKENLKTGLGAVEGVAGKNISLPILQNVLIKTEENFLSFTSTDLEIATRCWVLAKIVRDGGVVVPAKFLSSLVSSLPNDKITLEAKEKGVHIECKNIKSQIQGQNPDEFPIIPNLKDQDFFEVDNGAFCGGLSQIIDIAAQSQSRPEISGIYFVFSKNNIKIVATDSFRLGEKHITLGKAIKKECAFILPQKAAREVLSVLNSRAGNLKIYISPSQVLFEFPMEGVDHPQVHITSRLIEGEYPNYQDIIPTKFKTTLTLKREDFLHQIKTASLFSGKVNEVKVSVLPNKKEVEVFSRNADIGEHTSLIPAAIDGDPISVSFNYKFLVDGLQYIKSSELVFEISKEEGPCILRPVGDASYLYVVMPIKSI